MSMNEIREKYQYDRKLKRFSNEHFFGDHGIYSNVNSNKDVERHENYLKSTIGIYQKTYPLVKDDILDLEKAMGKFEIAVRKVIACFDNYNSDFNYNEEQLMSLIESVFNYHEQVDNLRTRKAMQD
ncbi:hypothetical protein P9E34_19690 [Schinkia azotoformans]|uniref:hypothetical protein n=1 Tax=Schinkia azotoformans TaxID=1454 RepID=UPI002DBA67C7|nr:hypothetical protein [Schinkia azotoformans]MEC1726935.1 hypothetical protein [Schinkia azotoformans]